MLKIGLLVVTVLILVTPLIADAQFGRPLIPTPGAIQGGDGSGSTNINPVPVPEAADIPGLVGSIINFLFGLLLAIAALFVFYAAYLYLTAAGNEDNVKKARSYIIYAVVAIVVAFLSRTVIALVREIILPSGR